MSDDNLPVPTPKRKPIVNSANGKVFASSRDVADFFEKEHKHVLRDIDNLLKTLDVQVRTTLFQEVEAFHEGANRQVRHFEMNRDGFTLLAFGFTGAVATAWKLKYLEAFNAMEDELKKIPKSFDWMRAVVDNMEAQNQRLFSVEKAVENLGAHEIYRSVLAHAYFLGVKGMDNKTANALGRAAAAISRQRGVKIGSQPDDRHGSVNTYHRDILDEVFKSLKPKA